MDASRYQEWLRHHERWFSLGASHGPESEPFKLWREALSPLVVEEGLNRGDDFSSFKERVYRAADFLFDLYSALSGVWERYANDGTFVRKSAFNCPPYWWRHFKLLDYLHVGTKDRLEHVEVNEGEVIDLAMGYLSMPWLRHPRLDWLFADALLFFPTFRAVQLARVTLAKQAYLGDQEKFKQLIERGHLSELKWRAAKGRLKEKLAGHALAWGIGLLAPIAGLTWLAIYSPPEWVAWLVVVPSVLLLLLTAWILLWWSFGVMRRAFGGRDTRPESSAKLAHRLEKEAEAWLDAYETLSAAAIPVEALRAKVSALPLHDGKNALLALLARVAERDGAVWLPFPR